MKLGFHVLERSVITDNDIGLFENKISILRFMQLVEKEGLEKHGDYTVFGLEDLLSSVEDTEEIIAYLHLLLRRKGNYYFNKQNTFQFLIERGKIEFWNDRPMLKTRAGVEVNLQDLFGNIKSYQDDPNWFWQQLNVSS